jgi:methylated-DNA-[protein]-cysteine S-methyltransferase
MGQRGRACGSFLFPLLRKLRRAKLDLSGYNEFQKRVYRALRRVPSGKTVSYGALAKRAGFPGAARAVGTAMKKNRLPIAIPCHRVIRGDGSLGQYGPGISWKRRLLEQEGAGLGPFSKRAKNKERNS